MTSSKNLKIGYYCIPIICLFFFHKINAQTLAGEALAYQNQFEKILSSDKADTLKLQYLLDNLNNLNARSSDQPIVYAKKGIALADQLADGKWSGLLHQELGWIYQGINEIDLAETSYKNAIDIFTKDDLLPQKIKAHGKLSLLYGQTNRSDQALQQAQFAIQLSEKLGDELGLAYAYYAIVYNYINVGKDQEALPYIEKSIALYKKHGEIYRMAVILQDKVTCYLHLNELENALGTANELIDTFREKVGVLNNDTDNYYLGQALYSRAKVYMQLQQYDKALVDNDSVQLLLSTHGTTLVNAVYIFQKAKILYYNKNYQASKEICLKLLNHPTVEAERFLGYTYEYLSKNYVALNQYKAAYRFHLEMERYEEKEIFHASKLKMEELEAKYETEKKEVTIIAQQQRLAQQRITQWLAIALAGILGLLFFQTYKNAISRKKNNEALRKSNTQLAKTNGLLAEKNNENEVLLKEIHHRVKNNLEIVSSLLELQSEQLRDVTTKNILKDSQNRVQSMGIIHQKLYQEGNLKSVEMREYFKNLAESILETYDAWEQMAIEINMDKLELDVEIAIPIGLIVNELITNAWKYAFPKAIFYNKKGNIKIDLAEIEEKKYRLIVSDDGIGKSQNSLTQGTGFGSQLINLLTQQLNGVMKEASQNGTTFTFDFCLNNQHRNGKQINANL